MKKESKIATFFGMNKYARRGAVSAVAVLVVLILAIAVNATAGLLPHSLAKINVTGSDTFKVSAQSVDWMRESLKEDVTLYLICDGGAANADTDLYTFLLRYEEASGHVDVEIVDPAAQADFIQNYGGEWPADRSVIVESGKRYKIIDNTELFYYYNSSMSMTFTAEEYQEALLMLAESEEGAAYLQEFTDTTTPYFDGEARVTNAINFVTRTDVPIVYSYTGSGASELDSSLKTLLSDTCYDMRTTLTLAAMPQDCDVLIIHAPTADLSEEEANALSAYLADGGKLLLTTFYATADTPRLDAVLATYGLSTEQSVHMVLEYNSNYAFSDSSASYPYLFKTHIASTHAATGEFDGEFIVYYPHLINITETEGVSATSWLYTSAAGKLFSYDETEKKWNESEEKAVYTVGAIAQKGESAVIWIASPDALTASINGYAANSGNFTLALSAMEWVSGADSDSIAIPSAAMSTSMLSVSLQQFLIWSVILILLIPGAILIFGIVTWCTRKKK